MAEEKRKEEENVKAEEAKRLAEEKRKEDERINTEKAKKAQLSGVINGHEWVDLGLSVKWATCNVGASSPTGYGNYYAWGETTTKSRYTESNSVTNGLSISKLKSQGVIGSDGNLTLPYDAARVNWGSTWRMPTLDEIKELQEKCSWFSTTMNGVPGHKVTGPNGNTIFFPSAGYRIKTLSGGKGSLAYYWSATPDSFGSDHAYTLGFYSDNIIYSTSSRFLGAVVRPVSDK